MAITLGTTILPCGLMSLLVNTFSKRTEAPMLSQDTAPGSVLAESVGPQGRLQLITHKLIQAQTSSRGLRCNSAQPTCSGAKGLQAHQTTSPGCRARFSYVTYIDATSQLCERNGVQTERVEVIDNLRRNHRNPQVL